MRFKSFRQEMDSSSFAIPQSTYRGKGEMGGMYLLSVGVYTINLLVMVDKEKGGGHAPPNPTRLS
jgi:hypothetical protein